jgi:hypothetical protein
VKKDHWSGFLDFATGVRDVGGNPLEVLRAHAAGAGLYIRERMWLAAVYGAFYSAPTAIVFTREWPLERALHEADYSMSGEILNKDLAALARKERRHHRTPKLLTECLQSGADWALEASGDGDDYESVWDTVGQVRYFGRYQRIKVAGALRWLGVVRAEQPDIRPKGAKLGRRTLGELDPEIVQYDGHDSSKNGSAAIDAASIAATYVKAALHAEGVDVGYFELESMLCEWQQVLGARLHPGKALEMDYEDVKQLAHRFGREHPAVGEAWTALRSAARPVSYVGPVREVLDSTYKDRGYIWSDSLYDWEATEDLDAPVIRSDATWTPRLPAPAAVPA